MADNDKQLPGIDQFGDDPKPKKKIDTLPDLSKLGIDSNEGLTGLQQNYRYDEFDRKFFGNTRSFQPKLGADNAKLRAQDQSGWEQAGLFFGNLVPNVAGSVIEGIGYLGSLLTEWGDDRDYNNAITQFGKFIQRPAGEIYRENPNDTWNLSDPAWWWGTADSLIPSIAAFAVEGAGFAKALSVLPKAARAIGAGAEIVRGARSVAQLATAAGLAYTEGAMSGARVFDATYQTQYRNLVDQGMEAGLADKQAKHIASQAAAATVQLNTIVNTALNITSVAPLFAHTDDIKTWFQKTSKTLPGESYGKWTERIRNMSAMDNDVRKLLNPRNELLKSYFSEAGQEGLEEMVNQWAENRGMERGRKGQELKGLRDLLGDTEEFFNDTMNSEGALNFVLGAVGGVAQTAVIDNIPVHRVYTDEKGNITDRRFSATSEDGKYQTKLISTRQRNALGGRSYFENIKDVIVKDIESTKTITENLAKAVEAGNEMEAERLRLRLFDAGAINSVQLGIGQAFSKQYEEIRDLDNKQSLSDEYQDDLDKLRAAYDSEPDPAAKQQILAQYQELQAEANEMVGVTEAMYKGFAKTPSDNTYKHKATKAIEDISYYEKLWDRIEKQHNTGDEWDSYYADYLFNKEVEGRRRGDLVRTAEAKLAEMELTRAASLVKDEEGLVGPIVSDLVADNGTREVLLTDISIIRNAVANLTSDDPQKAAKAEETLKNIASKYMPNGDSETELAEATLGVAKKIEDQIKSIDQENLQRLDNITQTPSYAAWKEKHPNKDVTAYVKDYRRNKSEDSAIEVQRYVSSTFKAETEIFNSSLKDLRSNKGRKQYIEKAKATRNRLIADIKAKTERDNVNAISRLMDNSNPEKLDNLQRKQYAKILKKEIARLQAQLVEFAVRKSQIVNDLAAINKKGLVFRAVNGAKTLALKVQLARINSQITRTELKINDLQLKLDGLESGLPTNTVALVEPAPPTAGPLQTASAAEATNEVTETEEYGEERLPSLDPAEALKVFLSNLNLSTKRKAAILADLSQYQRDIEAGISNFDWGMLSELGHVGKGKLSKLNAQIIMDHFQGALEYLNIPLFNTESTEDTAIGETEATIAEESTTAEETTVSIGDIPEATPPDTNEGQPVASDITAYADDDVRRHRGYKTTDAAKINALTHTYEQDIKTDENGEKYYNMKSDFQLNDYVNPLYIKPGYLKEGDQVILVPDTSWEGTVNETEAFIYGAPLQKGDNFKKYISPEGAILLDPDRVGNYPIKIVDPRSGTTLGYLPRLDWIRAKYPNTTDDYRNVANTIYGPNGEIVSQNNVQEQSERILLLRKKIAMAYNNGKTEGLTSTITERQRGHALRTFPVPANQALPDKSLKLALFGKEAVKTDSRTAEANVVLPPTIAGSNAIYSYSNLPGVLVPDAAGRMNFEPLWTEKLGKAEVDTTLRAIEVYLTVGNSSVNQAERELAEDHAKEIEEATGFDVTTHQGLKGFINQYYYFTKGFNDQETKANATALGDAPRKPEFKLAIAESIGEGFSKALIKAGITFMNVTIKAAVDEKGQINYEFSKLLHDSSMGLRSKFRNVVFTRPELGVTGINSQGAIREVVYQPQSKNLRTIDHENYNEMIKAYSKTTLHGTLKVGNDYVYYANPTTQIDYQGTMQQEIIATRKSQPSAADISVPVSEPDAFQEWLAQEAEPLTPAEENIINDLIKKLEGTNLGQFLTSATDKQLIRAISDQLLDPATAEQTEEVIGRKLAEAVQDLGYPAPDTSSFTESLSNINQVGTTFTENEASKLAEHMKALEAQLPQPEAPIDQARLDYLKGLNTNLDDDFNASSLKVVTSTFKTPGKSVSLENLEELRNFTPVEKRNNLTPTEALEQLVSLGYTTLPEGYNPFFSC